MTLGFDDDWDDFGDPHNDYNPGFYYSGSNNFIENQRDLLAQEIWISNGEEIPVSELDDTHLERAILYLESNPDFAFQEEWLEILVHERDSRITDMFG